jgi:hypothetical protein
VAYITHWEVGAGGGIWEMRGIIFVGRIFGGLVSNVWLTLGVLCSLSYGYHCLGSDG